MRGRGIGRLKSRLHDDSPNDDSQEKNDSSSANRFEMMRAKVIPINCMTHDDSPNDDPPNGSQKTVIR